VRHNQHGARSVIKLPIGITDYLTDSRATVADKVVGHRRVREQLSLLATLTLHGPGLVVDHANLPLPNHMHAIHLHPTVGPRRRSGQRDSPQTSTTTRGW